MEHWKPVKGTYANRYEVSCFGRVRSLDMQSPTGVRKGRLLALTEKSNVYVCVTLTDGKRRQQKGVHVIVAEVFIAAIAQGFHVCHNDGNRKNNAATNLRIDTPKNNCADRVKHGTAPIGSRHGMAKLKEHDVIAIRHSIKTSTELAQFYNVDLSHICGIKSRKTWKHI